MRVNLSYAAVCLGFVLLGACGLPAAPLYPLVGEPDSNDAGCIPTFSQTIYANSPSALYVIDPQSWMPQLVGPFGVDAGSGMTDMAVSPQNEIYTISLSSLFRVDASSGNATPIMDLPGDPTYNGLTFLPDGTLLAVTYNGAVLAIDLVSGATTSLGSYGNGLTSAGDLVAVDTGTLYGISYTTENGGDASNDNLLLTVDPKTGAATVIGSIGLSNVFGLGYYGGTLLAFTDNNQVARLDPATGAATILAITADTYWGAGVSPLVSAGCSP